MAIKTKLKLEIDSYYSESDINDLGMEPLNGHKMDHLIFKKDSKVYFFEKVEENLLRLFCSTSRKSFYLS